MLLEQPPGQGIGHLAGPVLPLGEGDQPVLPVGPEHLLECRLGPNEEFPPQLFHLRR